MEASAKMKESKKSKNDLLKDLQFQQEYMEEQRFAIKYMEYDLECTRRERDALRKEIDKLRGK